MLANRSKPAPPNHFSTDSDTDLTPTTAATPSPFLSHPFLSHALSRSLLEQPWWSKFVGTNNPQYWNCTDLDVLLVAWWGVGGGWVVVVVVSQ